MCGFCNVSFCVCVGFLICVWGGFVLCGFVCVGLVMCGFVYMCVL